MANGFHGSPEEWGRITAPLREVDDLWRDFARQRGLQVSENHRGWPERSLRWGVEIQKTIQVFLVDQDTMTFSFCISAMQDPSGKRLWRRRFLSQDVPWSEISGKLRELLEQGYQEVESWSEQDLEEV